MRVVAVALLVVLAACGSSGTRADQIEVGMCFDDQESQSVARFPTKPCDEPHQNEVFALFDAPDGDYPGVESLTALAERTCRGDAFERYVGEPYGQARFDTFQILPTKDTWEHDDDREIVCALYDPTDNTESRSARVRAA